MKSLRVGKASRGLSVAVAAITFVLMLAACGSSSSSSSSASSSSPASSSSSSSSASSSSPASSSSSASSSGGGASSSATAAKAIVAKLEQPVPFTVPALGTRPGAGKSVVVITCTLPICITDVGTGAKKLGWKYHVIEFDASKGPQAYVAAWDQALQVKPNYILTVGIFPPALVSHELAQAASAHIGVIGVVGLANNPAFKSCVNCSTYFLGAGARLADIPLAAGATGSGTVSVGDPSNIGTGQAEAGIDAEYARLHAGKPRFLALSLAHSQAENAAAVVNYVQSHPGTNTVINTLADLTDGLPAALKQAGLVGKVSYYVSAPQIADIGFVRAGVEGPALAIMNNAAWWNGLDQAVKLSAGKAVELNAGGWVAVMTKQNSAAMIAAGGSSRPEPPHYEQVYLKSWGVS